MYRSLKININISDAYKTPCVETTNCCAVQLPRNEHTQTTNQRTVNKYQQVNNPHIQQGILLLEGMC